MRARGGVSFKQLELYRDWTEQPNRSWSVLACARKPEAELIDLERSSSKIKPVKMCADATNVSDNQARVHAWFRPCCSSEILVMTLMASVDPPKSLDNSQKNYMVVRRSL